MNIFYVCIDAPRAGMLKSLAELLRTHYNKVGVKSSDISWYVMERDLKKRLLKTLGDSAVSVKIVGNSTMKSIKRAMEREVSGANRR